MHPAYCNLKTVKCINVSLTSLFHTSVLRKDGQGDKQVWLPTDAIEMCPFVM